MRKVKKITVLALTVVMGVYLAACGSGAGSSGGTSAAGGDSGSAAAGEESSGGMSAETSSSAGTGSGGGELTIGALTLFTASNLDPASEWNGWFDSMFGIGETLFELDDAMNPQPLLVDAYSYDAEGGLTWTLELRDDVSYTNGEKMTADTAKASLERTLEVCERAGEQLHIESMEAEGQTLTIVTDQPMPALLNELCDPMTVIEYVADGVDYENAPVLTGPFVAEEFAVNDIMVVSKNENYWGGEPKLDKITFKTYTDGDALSMALQAKEIDVAYDLPEASLALFETDEYQAFQTEGPRGQAIFFNCASDKVKDVQLRTAIAMAIDRQGYVDILNGNAVVNYGMFPDTMSCGGTARLQLAVTEESNLDTAAALLDEAGYTDSDGDGLRDKDGENLSLIFAIGSTDRESLFAQMLKSDLNKIGIELMIETYETTNTVYSDGKFDIGFCNMHMAPTGNPQYYYDIAFKSGAGYNQGAYSNPEVDALIEKLSTLYDPTERDEVAVQVQQKLMDDMYYIVFANLNFDCVAVSGVSGLNMNPSEYYIVDMTTAIGE